MRCVMLMFDSLNRHMLSPYGCDWTHTPNFRRLATRCSTFDTSYVCSMPCMPARRDLHTGRPNFLHRSWGPLEPFDQSVFEVLREQAGVYSHLVTDHYHYFEVGGATYHPAYDTWDFVRGPEGDPWVARVGPPPPDVLPREGALGRNARAYDNEPYARQDFLNRKTWRDDDSLRPMARTFRKGVQFVRDNVASDNWVLHLETFDPHEPFDAPRSAQDLFATHFNEYRANGGKHYDWPLYDYASAQATPEQVEHLKFNYAALLADCDAKLGDVLDLFDELDLWKDTMLVVWTDHGFFLGERDCLGKLWMPWWDTIARTPLFIHDPHRPTPGERRKSLVQPAIDLAPTLLDLFGVDREAHLPHATGRSLRPVVHNDESIHEKAVFGAFGQQVNVTDGRYVYMRAADPHQPRPPEYTLMPTEMRRMFPARKFGDDLTLAGPFNFTRGARVMRITGPHLLGTGRPEHPYLRQTLLYDTQTDPQQASPLNDPAQAERLTRLLAESMHQFDAPEEQYTRLGLPRT